MALAHHDHPDNDERKRGHLHDAHESGRWHTTIAPQDLSLHNNGHNNHLVQELDDPRLVDEMQLRDLQHDPLLPFRQFSLQPLLFLPLGAGGRRGALGPTPPSLPVSSADTGTHKDQVLDPVHLLLVLRDEGEDVRQLFHRQRQRNIERR